MACECQFCSLKHDFVLDEHLREELENRRCVIFAGAGISTETSGAHESSLYQELSAQVGSDKNVSFPELVDLFEKRPNGRQKLIEKIKDRFDYIDGWRDLRRAATAFHKSLSTAPYFSKIITTNWDRYFEDIIRATPFVYDSDLAFWEDAKRPLLKIHGSIDNLSTIVASSDDYRACEERLKSGRLGDILRHIFATQTVIFVGYSATDSDFRSIFEAVRSSMGRFARTHYLVSPFLSDAQMASLRDELGICGIRTSATHFMDIVKGHMREKFCFAYDESYDRAHETLINLIDEHEEFVQSYAVSKEPHLIFATAYQDGLIHCLQRIVDHRYTNDFADLHRVRGQAQLYAQRHAKYAKDRDYWNSSYFIGYEVGLIYFDILNADLGHRDEVSDELLNLPFYFHPKVGCLHRDEFADRVRPYPQIHKAAYKQALRVAQKFDGSEGIVIQHSPFG